MRRAIFTLSLALLPALASGYSPDKDRENLRVASQSCYLASHNLVGTALLPEKIELLKSYLDYTVKNADTAAAAAQALCAGPIAPLGVMLVDFHGTDSRPGLKKLIESAEASLAEDRERWKDIKDRLDAKMRALTSLKKRIEKHKKEAKSASAGARKHAEKIEKDDTRRKRGLSLHRDAAKRVKKAKRRLKRAEDKVRRLKEERKDIEYYLDKCAKDNEEMQGPCSSVVARAKSLKTQRPITRTRLEGIGTPPENVSRTRAGQAIEPVSEHARVLRESADIARSRAEDFARHRRNFGLEREDFDAEHEDYEEEEERAKKDMDAAEKLLDRI